MKKLTYDQWKKAAFTYDEIEKRIFNLIDTFPPRMGFHKSHYDKFVDVTIAIQRCRNAFIYPSLEAQYPRESREWVYNNDQKIEFPTCFITPADHVRLLTVTEWNAIGFEIKSLQYQINVIHEMVLKAVLQVNVPHLKRIKSKFIQTKSIMVEICSKQHPSLTKVTDIFFGALV